MQKSPMVGTTINGTQYKVLCFYFKSQEHKKKDSYKYDIWYFE